ILVEYKSKYPNHVECAKALELYLPCLRDYVKSNYSLGQVWSSTGKAVTAASSKAPRPSCKQGMSAVFQEINSGKPVTFGLRKVTDDMKMKNCAGRTGVVGSGEKETRTSKVNNITVDKCTKMGVVFRELECLLG
ncbi:hypothetical protein G4B88_017290, partial [Cannabis sativa]